jgi:hypothetical protein
LDLSQRLASVWGVEFSSPSAISQESRAFGVRCGPRARGKFLGSATGATDRVENRVL